MKKNNPFTLTFGKQPGEYINRYENTEMILSTFESDNPIAQAYLIEGVRGSGKTVLMTSIANILSDRDDWVVVNLNSTGDLIADFALRLHDAAKPITDIIKSGFNLSIAGFGIGVTSTNQLQDNISIVEELLSELKKKKKKVLITIDEVTPTDNMKYFASQFQIWLRQDYPLFLLMTGLYENVYAIQNDPALTFLLRTPKITMEPLSIQQITKQYKSVLNLELDDAYKMALETKGYAFAFQALGMLYFEYGDELQFEEILSKLDDLLDDFVYKKIWESLSDKDRIIVKSIGDAPVSVSELSEKLNIQQTSFSRYKERLIKRGLIVVPSRGMVALSLPRFANVVSYYR